MNETETIEDTSKALYEAMCSESIEAVDAALEAGADIRSLGDYSNYPPIHHAAFSSLEILDKLLAKAHEIGGDEFVKEIVNPPRVTGAKNTLLHDAVRCGGVDDKVVKMLVNAGADVFATNARGYLPHQIQGKGDKVNPVAADYLRDIVAAEKAKLLDSTANASMRVAGALLQTVDISTLPKEIGETIGSARKVISMALGFVQK